MKYIYGILCHRMTNPLRFLIDTLSENSDCLILIHVDQKSDISPFIEEFGNLTQVQFIQHRINVLWGSFSQIEATFELLKTAQEYTYKYFTLLSGDDIPLQDIGKFHQYLDKNAYEYLDLDENPDTKIEPRVKFQYDQAFFKKHRTPEEQRHCKWQRRLFKIGVKRNNLKHLPKLYKGSQWFTLSQHAINYIFNYLETHPDYIRPFRTSLCGDELFFHTILFNSPLSPQIRTKRNMSESFLRYIDWQSGPDFPRTLSETDFEKMKNSRMFFARKIQNDIPLDILKNNFDY